MRKGYSTNDHTFLRVLGTNNHPFWGLKIKIGRSAFRKRASSHGSTFHFAFKLKRTKWPKYARLFWWIVYDPRLLKIFRDATENESSESRIIAKKNIRF